MYDYKKGNQRLNDIFKSTITVEERKFIPSDEEFTFENGYKTWVSSIFVDIRNSRNLFENENQEEVSKLMRAFTSEICEIMSNYDNNCEIGIRGDCVYGIFSTPYQKDTYQIVRMSFYINTFIKLLNLKIKEYTELNPISVGIGVASSEIIVIKSGRKYKGINDKIWIGDAVVEASHLSSIANRTESKPIVFSKLCYDNFIKLYNKDEPGSSSRFDELSFENKFCYTANIIMTEFNEYINSLNQ